MEPLERTEFKLEDRFGDRPLTAANVSLPILREFLNEVEAFIKGDNVKTSLVDSQVKIETGSLLIAAYISPQVAADLNQDLATLTETADLDSIQRKRSEIIEKWQSRAGRNPNRRYSVALNNGGWAEISSEQGFRRRGNELWVEVEKYLTGTIVDLGGKSRPNVRIVLQDTAETLKVEASEDQLTIEKDNHLYKVATLHVRAEQHLDSRKLRNIRLLEFVPDLPVDEDALQALWRNGEKAWRSVPSATAWVEELRGNTE